MFSLLVGGVTLPTFPQRVALLGPEPCERSSTCSPSPSQALPTAQYFSQKLDHSDAQNTAMWKQRYYVNDTFFKGAGPIFLCIGGEGPALQPTVVVTGDNHCADMMEASSHFEALVFAVEHRYYGESIPTGDFTTANLTWLSSAQALADLAEFIKYQNAEFKLTAPTNKWITFGGSYSGALSAWMRGRYPDLVDAAVASSAPVKAVANFEGYNNVVAASLEDVSVGGSQDCLTAVQKAFDQLGSRLTEAQGRRTLETIFFVCDSATSPLDNIANQQKFMETVSELFPIQTNYPNCSEYACDIKKQCNVMLESMSSPENKKYAQDPLQRLSTMAIKLTQGNCMPVNAKDDTASLMDTSLNGTVRPWFYQTCTEFGFYQTCDPGTKCPFTQTPWLNNVSSYYSLCDMAFEITAAEVEEKVQNSNLQYGGDHPNGTRIMFVNGEIDPWHAASVLDATNMSDVSVLLVKGASHHTWTHPTKSTDQQSVVDARAAIRKQIAQWLEPRQRIRSEASSDIKLVPY